MALRIELLGNLRITQDQRAVTAVNTNRLRSLLAYLVLHADAPQPREYLSFLLWPESNESQARTNLRQLLHHLRRALADVGCLLTDNQTVHWQRDPACVIDVDEFEAAFRRAQEAGRRADLAAERQALEQAERLYQDDLLPGVYDDWLEPKREQLRQQFSEALSRLAALLESLGEHSAAIRYAERLVAHDPLSEAHYQLLIRLHAANHDRASALRAYHRCMRVFKRELGVDPGPVTRELFEQVLKSEPIRSAHVELPPASAASPLPLVGRRKEWERLRECWRVAADGETRLALILGEAGIGKSRLAEELFQYCAGQRIAAARTRCYAAQNHLSYSPVTDWLRAEPLQAARAQLPAPHLAELARVLPEILVERKDIKPPQPLAQNWQRRHFYDALNAAFGKARKPLLLVIDDLQWCDLDSFEWLHSFCRSEQASQVLVAGTVRPEEAGREHPLTGLLSDLRQTGLTVELSIGPLSADETGALAGQIANRPLDPHYLKDLYAATGGNPLFVVESVRAGDEDPQRTSSKFPGSNAEPRPVGAVITARLARLSRSAYELAGLAATIGTSFSIDLLAKATDWDEDSLSRALDELWQRRIVDGQGAGAYDFTHDRLREVAYSELSPVRQRFLHRRVARAIEELHAGALEGIHGQVAGHYEAAGMLEPAIRHYHDAAVVAQQRCADTEAVLLIQRALTLGGELKESAVRDTQELDLLAMLGRSLVTTRGYSTPEVGETYARALMLSRRLGEKNHYFSALGGSWLFHTVRGQLEGALALGRQLLELARNEDSSGLSMAGHFLYGGNLFHLGRLEEARQHVEQSLAVRDERPHSALPLFFGPDIGVFCQSYRAHVLWHLGLPDQSAKACEEALARALRVAHPFSLAIALAYAALLHSFRRESGATLAQAEEAAALCRKHDFPYYLAWSEILAGWAMAVEGNVTPGVTRLRSGLDALRNTAAELRLPFYHAMLAQVCGLAGQFAEAQANIATGLAFQRKNHELWAAPELHRIQGDLVAIDNPGEAYACYQRAFEAARNTGARALELRAATSMCRLPLAPDTLAEARSRLQNTYRQFTEGFDTPDLTEARSVLRDTARTVPA